MLPADQDRQTENAKSARKQNGARKHLDQELEVRPHRMQVIVKTQQENQETGNQDGQQRPWRKPEAEARIPPANQTGDPNAEQKRQEDGHPTQAGKRSLVQVPLQTRAGYPAASRG